MPSFPSRRSPRPPSRCTGSCAHRAIRAPANLNTCSVVAVNVETGKMAWYFQTSPNDTHDWDRSEEHTSELQSLAYLVCRLLLEKKKKKNKKYSRKIQIARSETAKPTRERQTAQN